MNPIMERKLIWLTPAALLLLAASCSDDETKGNGVPNPTAGSGGVTALGGSGGKGSGVGGKPAAGGGGAPSEAAGSNGAGEGGQGEAGSDGEGGAAGAATMPPYDGTCATLPGTVVYVES